MRIRPVNRFCCCLLFALAANATAQEAPVVQQPPAAQTGLVLERAASFDSAEDACLAAVRERSAEAERSCSDLIAGLRYDGAAVSGNPALAGALNNRALARMRAGDLEGAAGDLAEALELAPGAWAIHMNRARLALMNGDAAAALNELGRVRELVPADSAAAAAAERSSVLAWRLLGNLDAAAALSGAR